jgi:hypothetical protein
MEGRKCPVSPPTAHAAKLWVECFACFDSCLASGRCGDMTRLLDPIIAFHCCRTARRRDGKSAAIHHLSGLRREKAQHLFPCHLLINGFSFSAHNKYSHILPSRSPPPGRPPHDSETLQTRPGTWLCSALRQVDHAAQRPWTLNQSARPRPSRLIVSNPVCTVMFRYRPRRGTPLDTLSSICPTHHSLPCDSNPLTSPVH